MVSQALFTSKTDEWGTPRNFFENLNHEFNFDLDVCATAENALCADYFDVQRDGLQQSWAPRRCWMNPPYSQIGAWVAKADRESELGALVVCLIPARTDTRWFHAHVVGHEIRYVKGRLKFGDARNSAPFPSLVVVMRRQ